MGSPAWSEKSLGILLHEGKTAGGELLCTLPFHLLQQPCLLHSAMGLCQALGGVQGYSCEQPDAPPVPMELQVQSGPHPLASHDSITVLFWMIKHLLECSAQVIGERPVSNTGL